MALDATIIHHLAQELNERLSGARIDKIQQPGRFEMVFLLRTKTGNERMILSVADQPRVHLTRDRRENPEKAPMFCMLLRKHIGGGKILSVSQPGLERILILNLECTDELGERSKKTLIAELIGRHSNLILVGNDNRIIECMKRVDYEMSPIRPVLPGLFYLPPPAPEKPLFFETEQADFSRLLSSAPAGVSADKWMTDTLWGLSPLISRELVFRATGDTASALPLSAEDETRLFEALSLAAEGFRSGSPLLFTRPGEALPFELSFMPILQYGDVKTERCNSWSDLLAAFFDQRASAKRLSQARQTLTRDIRRARDRLAKKLREQTAELETARGRETLKRSGDLLMAQLHLAQKGMSRLALTDLFEETQPTVEIALDPRLSPRENAQKYYHDYARMKSAEHFLSEQIASGGQTLQYLESVLDELERADNPELIGDIREELIEAGYLKAEKKRKKPRPPAFSPRTYQTQGGFTVLVGRNNRENEQLTLKTADRADIWFHVKNAPGAHAVLLREGKIPSDRDLTDAALLAAFHSSLSASALVPVDYTEIRHVRKLKGGGPGMVTYVNYKTAFVTPDKDTTVKMAERAAEDPHR